MVEDEGLLLEVLNSTPVEQGRSRDLLDGDAGAALSARHGGTGSPAELEHVREMRRLVQDAVRGAPEAPRSLQRALQGVSLTPAVSEHGIDWELSAPGDRLLAARVALAWARVADELPGRLRPCANGECHLFLVDHSKPGRAKWCSMATCGNRMKARAHAARVTGTAPTPAQR
nr:CGNR zinc finger domain-containing protein [uncultured Actinotalea sp.]